MRNLERTNKQTNRRNFSPEVLPMSKAPEKFLERLMVFYEMI